MKRLLLCSVVSFVFFVSCFAQNSNVQNVNNDAQRIIGTWKTEVEEIIFTFNADGTFTISGKDVSSYYGAGNYMIANSKLILRHSKDIPAFYLRDYYLSTDGRILAFLTHLVPINV